MTVLERIDRWHWYAATAGIDLVRILIHPRDLHEAPKEYKGLPVLTFGSKA